MERLKSLALTIGVLSLLLVGCSNDSGSVSPLANSGEPQMSPATWAFIGDLVWFDMDCDGIQDIGEPGVEGVVVHLFDCQNNFVRTAVTDAIGFYWIEAEWDIEYYLVFELPDGYNFSPRDQGRDDGVDSDVEPLTGRTICTLLEGYEEDPTWDAGLCMDIPDDGCTHTIGFWKNHDGFGPQDDEVSQHLPISLGTAKIVTTAEISTAVLKMKTYGKPSNGITKLYAQLLGAKLSIASGASGHDIDRIITAADNFLSMHDHNDWASLSRSQKN